MSTTAIEDYLKTIYDIQAKTGKVTTTQLAQSLAVAPASATNMLKKLAELKLVRYQPYYGAYLTKAGETEALRIINYFRLIEAYLIKQLRVPKDQAQAYAHDWEHILSEEVAARMRAVVDGLAKPGSQHKFKIKS